MEDVGMKEEIVEGDELTVQDVVYFSRRRLTYEIRGDGELFLQR
jgi:hypothetical protein